MLELDKLKEDHLAELKIRREASCSRCVFFLPIALSNMLHVF